MPIIGSKQEGNIRMLECLKAMNADYKNGKLVESTDLKTYTNQYAVTTIPKSLAWPIIVASEPPRMKDVITLRKQLAERQRMLKRQKRERESNLFTLQPSPANEPTESELIMKVISLGYAVFKVNVTPNNQ